MPAEQALRLAATAEVSSTVGEEAVVEVQNGEKKNS